MTRKSSRRTGKRSGVSRSTDSGRGTGAADASGGSASGGSSRQKSGATPRRTATRRTAAPERKRGTYVALGVGGALVAALCGYGIFQDSQRVCVDRETMTILDDVDCHTGSGGGFVRGVWYYGGSGGSVGEKATGGSFERGGFGSYFSGGG